jgi:hypothetical protein
LLVTAAAINTIPSLGPKPNTVAKRVLTYFYACSHARGAVVRGLIAPKDNHLADEIESMRPTTEPSRGCSEVELAGERSDCGVVITSVIEHKVAYVFSCNAVGRKRGGDNLSEPFAYIGAHEL